MDRETKEVVLPSGAKVSLYTYITARERNQFRDELYKDVRINMNPTGQNDMSGVGGESLLKAEHKALEVVMVSLNGSTENCIERLLDGSPQDYDAVVAAVNEVTGTLSQAK